MKKNFLFAGGLLALLATNHHLHAQDARDSAMYAKNEKNGRTTAAAGGIEDVPARNAISKKATRAFAGTYKTATDVKWFAVPDGSIAYFTIDGIRNRSHYDKKGNWLYNARYYNEKKLPVAVRAEVKSTYYDYAISGVQEIQVENKTIYLLYLADEISFKTIRVCDGEMDVLESFSKTL